MLLAVGYNCGDDDEGDDVDMDDDGDDIVNDNDGHDDKDDTENAAAAVR